MTYVHRYINSIKGDEMKKYKAIMITISVLFFLMAEQVFANCGSITIANWMSLNDSTVSGNTVTTIIYVSNVGPNDISVTLRLYDSEGNEIGDAAFVPTVTPGAGFSSTNSLGNVGVLPTGKTSTFTLKGSGGVGPEIIGYGKIEWSSIGSNRDHSPLVVDGVMICAINYPNNAGLKVFTRPVVITKDQPF